MADDLLSLSPPEPSAVEGLDLRPIELLKQGWEFIKPNYLEVLGLMLGVAVLNAVLSRIPVLGMVLSLVVGAIAGPAFFYFLLERYRGNRVGLEAAIIPAQRKPVPLIIAYLLTIVIVGIGFVLLVLPGIYAAVVLILVTPLVLLTNTSPVDALKASHRIVSARLGDWFLLLLGIGVANFAGALLCGLGLLVSIPATLGALTILYARIFKIAPAPAASPVLPPSAPA